jgi:hypothetical protein
LFPSHSEEMIASILIEAEVKVTVKSEDIRGGGGGMKQKMALQFTGRQEFAYNTCCLGSSLAALCIQSTEIIQFEIL